MPFLNKKQKQQKSTKHCKSNRNDSHQHHLIRIETNPNCHHSCNINATHCYLYLPSYMAEDNPLDVENIKGNKMRTIIFNKLHQAS
jgi:hypothetical protein